MQKHLIDPIHAFFTPGYIFANSKSGSNVYLLIRASSDCWVYAKVLKHVEPSAWPSGSACHGNMVPIFCLPSSAIGTGYIWRFQDQHMQVILNVCPTEIGKVSEGKKKNTLYGDVFLPVRKTHHFLGEPYGKIDFYSS